ncbi:Isoamylase 2, chloroplastic -like protein [Gossypium arboreum]|uniref:Isoamylase 2, chloroplastic-like protein n=1 Tax=Gossypium arboreum TaxID=29729 RepID=A0A0B0MBY8_GOSAR|nr:Isoamylase 2, chloroplastic -like protein [Gossypium arboreum]
MCASVRPCLGHGIGIETSTSVRNVWDMHRPRDVSQCQTCLEHASATRCASVRHVWDTHRYGYMCQCKTYLGHSINTNGRKLVQDHSWTMWHQVSDVLKTVRCSPI